MVSVIVPVHNTEKYLSQCIESILRQDTKIELILIDDGSSDKSGKICDKYSDKALVFHTENQGVAAARNLGVSKASGEFIAFVDSDDWIEPHHISKMLNSAEETHADIVISGLIRSSDGRRETVTEMSGIYTNDKKNEQILFPLVGGDLGNPFKVPVTGSACISLYKRELIKDINLPNTNISEDLIFQIKAVNAADIVSKIDSYTYNYRIGEDTRSNRYFPDFWENHLQLIELMSQIDEIKEHTTARIIRSALNACGNECISCAGGNTGERIQKIKSILKNDDLQKSIKQTKNKKYPLKAKLIFFLMKNKLSIPIYLYLKIRKRGE